MVKRTLAVVALAWFCPAAADAAVTRIEVVKVERVEPSTPASPRAMPVYERLTGKFYGELDPADPKNALITDIQLAPRNARGKVEYVGTFTLMKPVDREGQRRADLLRRQSWERQATASAEGHISLVSGWQGDVVPTANNQTIQVPRAKNPDGSSVTGPLTVRILDQSGTTARLLIPRNTPRLSGGDARNVEGDADFGRRRKRRRREGGRGEDRGHRLGVRLVRDDAVSRHAGSAAHLPEERLRHGALYELQYTVKDPLVLGIGFAATRDLNAFFRYEKADAPGTPNPVAGVVRWAHLGRQLAVGHVPARVHPARFQSGRSGTDRLGGQQPEHRGARHRHEPPLRAAGRRRRAVRVSAPRRRCGGRTGTTRRADAASPVCSIAAARPTRARRSWRRSAARRSGICARRSCWSAPMPRPTSRCPTRCDAIIFPVCTHGGGRGGFSSAETAATAASCRRIRRRARRCERR